MEPRTSTASSSILDTQRMLGRQVLLNQKGGDGPWGGSCSVPCAVKTQTQITGVTSLRGSNVLYKTKVDLVVKCVINNSSYLAASVQTFKQMYFQFPYEKDNIRPEHG